MKKLLTALTVFSFTATAYALTGSFFQDDREYGLTDEFYPVSEIDSLNGSLPEGCELLSCDDALTLKGELNYSADYFFCNKGVIDNYRNSICSIVDISGQKYVECNGSFLDTTSFRAFVSCPIFSENATENETDNATLYLDFSPDNNTYYCAKDINETGFFDDPSEIQQCIEADNGSGYVCPIDKVSCEATYEEPLCPEGTLNTERDMCQADPLEINCPAGYTWDSSLDKCVITPTCPEDGVFNPATDRCEKQVINECPDGYSYDQNRDVCYKNVTCPTGTTYNPSTDRCEKDPIYLCPAGYTYNYSIDKCEMSPSCPSGTTYNSERDRCEKSLESCPEGYTYNAVLDKCVRSVECPDGGTLNPNTDKCELAATPVCPDGWTLNESTGKCEKAPVCSEGGTYNPTYNLCLVSITGIICPTGYTYSSTYSACIKAPYCPTGSSYNSSTNRCETVPSYTCPSGWTYNNSLGICEMSPQCPSGMTYSNSLNRCIAFAQTQCPSGYTYNSSTGRCEASPICPSGFTYSSATNRCETGASISYTCSSNGQSYLSLSTCQANCQTSGSCSEEETDEICIVYFAPAPQDTASEPIGFSLDTYTQSLKDVLISKGCKNNEGIIGCPLSVVNSSVTCPNESVDGEGAVMMFSHGSLSVYPSPSGSIKLHLKSTYTCSLNGQSYSDLSTCQANCVTTGTCSQIGSCPSGSTLSGSLCIANPSCPSGGTFDGNADVCYTNPSYSCSVGTYDSSSGYCIANAYCGEGTLNTTRDICELSPDVYCPTGFTLSGNICYTPAQCSEGTLDTSIDYCKAEAQFTCPTGYTYSFTYNSCYKTPDCGSGSLNPASDVCQLAYTLTCPSAYSLSGTICQLTPTCLSPGSYNAAINLCDAGNNLCGSFSFDGNNDVCYTPAECGSEGTLNTERDMCETAITGVDCGGYTYDSSARTCYTLDNYCEDNSYDSSYNQCIATVGKNCGTYSLSSENNQLCIKEIECPADSSFSLSDTISYSSVLDKCVSDAEHICPSGDTYVYTWNRDVLKCELVPICANGVYTPETDGCYVGDLTCPIGDYPCLPIGGENYCSPNPCERWSDALEYDDTPEGINDKQADGEIDENGNCLGTIYIFNGRDKRCRPPGLQTGGSDCCRKTTTWFGLGTCKESEKILAKLRSWGQLDGQCHYIGSYCAVKVLGVCLQKKKTFCCFNSVLARIIQEQGRPQLGIGWGDAKHPNCRGFTPEEFQKIDFSKIDFSEWLPEIEQNVSNSISNVQSQIEGAAQTIQDYYQQ